MTSSQDRLPRWAPMLLASRSFPAGEPLATAPFERSSLTATHWFDPAALAGQGPTITLAEMLAAMLGSPEAASPALEQIGAWPDGIWIDLELPPRDLQGSGPIHVGAFHRRLALSPGEQIVLGWYGQRLPQLEGEARRLHDELEQVRRALAQQEGALRLERNRVEGLLEAVADPVSLQDTEYRILAQNASHRRIFGERRGEACYRVYRGASEPCTGCPMGEALASGEAAGLEDQPAGGPYAGSRVALRVLPLYRPDSAPAGIVEVFSVPLRAEEVETAAVERDVEVVSQAVRLRDYELQHILDVLERSGGNRAQAARLLGISRATLWRRLGAQQPRRGRAQD